jgi:hypothetical protein
MKYFILILLLVNISLPAFPGDQDPLSCVFAFHNMPKELDEAKAARQDLFDKGLAKGKYAYGSPYQTTNHPSLSEEEYKAKMKEEAEAQFRTAIRKFHDRSVSITKLGDSLSDLVDVYGVIKPEYWGLHPAFGAIGRNPFYMDSWGENETPSTFCVLKRGIEINFGVNQTDPTNDPHSALRSSLNIQ